MNSAVRVSQLNAVPNVVCDELALAGLLAHSIGRVEVLELVARSAQERIIELVVIVALVLANSVLLIHNLGNGDGLGVGSGVEPGT